MKLVRAMFLSAALMGAAGATAQDFPSAPITIVVPYSPGGGTDLMARLVGQELGQDLGVSVVIENRPGASGNIGTTQVAKARPDGYTLLFTSSGHAINPSLFKNLPFDPIKDFEPVLQLASGPSVLVVNAQSSIQTPADLINAGKSGKELTFGSAGLGQPTHLVAERFAAAGGIKILHVPYKGSGAAEIALAGGETDFLIDSIPAALPLIRAGRTRALATTGDERFPIDGLQDVPTLQESGMKDFNFVTWWGILAPAGTDPSRIDALSKALDKAMQSADLQQRFVEIGATPSIKSPEAFKTYISSELKTYRKLISDLNIQAQ